MLMMPTQESASDPERQDSGDGATMKEAQPAQRLPAHSHSWLERIDVFAKLVLSLAAVLLSGAIGWATLDYNRQAAQRQIQNQVDSLALQRRITAAQMLASHLTTILQGNEQERALTLRLLETVDPELVRQIGEKLLSQAKSPAAVEAAKRIITSSTVSGREYALAQHLENARKYRDFGLDPAAVREYMKAYEALPATLKPRLAKEAQAATKDYEAGDYSGAARSFEELFRAARTPL